MRIFDRVASGETAYLQDGNAPTDLQIVWRRAANTSTRLVVDEAAQFVYQSGRADWSVAEGAFGSMSPPFYDMWIEWQTPSQRYLFGSWHALARNRMAAHVTARGEDLHIEVLTSANQRKPIGMLPISVQIVNAAIPGKASQRVDVYPEIEYLNDARFPGMTREEYGLGLALELWPVYLTLGWMNCRNVATADVSPNARIAAKRQRRGQPRGLDYKRIILDEGTRRALTGNRDAERHGKRLHIVRGHIKHYTAERPLFGKLTGNYWWHQQMRGDATLGRINHEYHVTSRGPR